MTRVKVSPGQSTRVDSAGLPEIVNAFWQNESVYLVAPGGGLRRVDAEFSVFVETAELDRETRRQLAGSRAVAGMADEGKWTRIRCRDNEWRKKVVSWLGTEQVITGGAKRKPIANYEGNVSPVRRCLLEFPHRIVKPRTCYLDIETDSRLPFSKRLEMRILCWSVVDGERWREKAGRFRGMLSEDTDAAEKELLRELWAVLKNYDQIVAWNGDRFDFAVIRHRTRERGIAEPVARWLWLDHMDLFERMNMSASESGDEKQSMKLENVAQSVIGEGKKQGIDGSQSWEFWEAGGEKRQLLGDYCEQDTLLMPMIEHGTDKAKGTGYIALLWTIAEACGSFPDSRGINPQQQVEAFLLRLAKSRGYKPRSQSEDYRKKTQGYFKLDAQGRATNEFVKGEVNKYAGALVMEPKCKGIAKDVHVCDFAGMYPSIIRSWNISPDTKNQWWTDTPEFPPPPPGHSIHTWNPKPNKLPDGFARAPISGVVYDQRERGILPEAIEQMIALRKEWDARKSACAPGTPEWEEANRRSMAYKITANSFYGVVGAPLSIFFDRHVAESVALGGQWLIRLVNEAAEARGMSVVYGDTDSLFVSGQTRHGFEEFIAWCNAELFPTKLREAGAGANYVKLAYEKQFERLVMVASKKYAGTYAHYKGTAATADSKPEVKGLEYKRGDAVRLARRLQIEAIDLLMRQKCESPEPFVSLVERYRAHVLDAELELVDVMESKKLTQRLAQYKSKLKNDGTPAAQQPHVEIAKILAKRGRDTREGSKIDYFCIDGSTSPKRYLPAEDWAGACDRYELWEGRVYPPTQRLLEAAFPGGGWKNWAKARPPKVRAVAATPARSKKADPSGTLSLFGLGAEKA